jgi:hypothetical protein
VAALRDDENSYPILINPNEERDGNESCRRAILSNTWESSVFHGGREYSTEGVGWNWECRKTTDQTHFEEDDETG